MKASEPGRVKASISLPAPMAEWLRCEAQHEMANVSNVIQRHLLPAMKVSQTVYRDELLTVLKHAETLDEARDLVQTVLGDLRFTRRHELRDKSDPCGPNTELVARIAADRLAVLRGQAKRKGR
jgi:hypothetical protein